MDHTILLLDPGNLRLGRREGGRQASFKPQAGQPLLTLVQSITEMDTKRILPYSCPYMGWAESSVWENRRERTWVDVSYQNISSGAFNLQTSRILR